MNTPDTAKAYIVGATVEYSVRAAMHGVYGLLGLKREIPAIYHGITDPKVVLEALKTLMG